MKIPIRRYYIVLVLFFVGTVSYIDRVAMSISIPYIAKDFHLSPVTMGVVMSAFFLGYAVFQIPGGMIVDSFGSRKTMALAIVWWSVFTFFTGLVNSLTAMIIIRVLFGMGEASLGPASWKTLANWLPVQERTAGNAYMISSSQLGSAFTPLLMVALMTWLGWRVTYYSLFIPGVIMALVVWFYCRDKPSETKFMSPQEIEYIETKTASTGTLFEGKKASLGSVLKTPLMWQLFFIMFTYQIPFWGFRNCS